MDHGSVALMTRFYPPAYSGAGQQARRLARAMARAGWTVTVVTSASPGRRPGAECLDGVRVETLGVAGGTSRFARWGLSLRWLGWILRAPSRLDNLVFFSIGTETYLPLLVARILGLTTVVRVSQLGHDDLSSVAEERWGGVRLSILCRADAVVCLTDAVHVACENALSAFAEESRPKCVVIPNGVDLNRFRPLEGPRDRDRLREQLGVDPRAFVGVFVGYMHPRKSVHHLLEVWHGVCQAFSSASLLLIGPRSLRYAGEDWRPYLETLDHMTGQLGLQESVVWVETDDVRPYLQVADAFLFASLQEGFPNALLEAMACGVAPFVVRREWLPDGLIDTGVNGYLVGTDVGEMVEALLAAVDRGDIHRVGAAAAVRAAEDFDIDLQAARYTELLGASRMSGTPSSGQA